MCLSYECMLRGKIQGDNGHMWKELFVYAQIPRKKWGVFQHFGHIAGIRKKSIP